MFRVIVAGRQGFCKRSLFYSALDNLLSNVKKNADALVAFWDGKSRGTRNMIHEATKHGLKRRIVFYK